MWVWFVLSLFYLFSYGENITSNQVAKSIVPLQSPNVNDAFVQGGIDAGKPFYLGSSPDISNYRAAWNALEGNRGSHPQTVFFREMKQLRDAGYRLEGDYMLPPK